MQYFFRHKLHLQTGQDGTKNVNIGIISSEFENHRLKTAVWSAHKFVLNLYAYCCSYETDSLDKCFNASIGSMLKYI